VKITGVLVVVHTFYSCLKLTFVDDLAHLDEKYTVLHYLFVFLVCQDINIPQVVRKGSKFAGRFILAL
jgi:hypothetical protein